MYVTWVPSSKINMCYPFYHMEHEPFWCLVKSKSYEKRNEYKSFTALQKNFLGALLDKELYGYLADVNSRECLAHTLIDNYLGRRFDGEQPFYVAEDEQQYNSSGVNQMSQTSHNKAQEKLSIEIMAQT